MAEYADLEAVKEYLGADYADLTEAELEKAQEMVDELPLVHNWGTDPWRSDDTGLQLDPAKLMPFQATTLMKEVARQAAYIREMGDSFFITHQYEYVSGGGIARKGKLDRYAPKMRDRLAKARLMQPWGSSSNTGRSVDSAGGNDPAANTWGVSWRTVR